MLGDDGAQRVPVLGRPARGVAGGVGPQHRGLAGGQVDVDQEGRGWVRHLVSSYLVVGAGASSSAARRTACAASVGRVRGK